MYKQPNESDPGRSVDESGFVGAIESNTATVSPLVMNRKAAQTRIGRQGKVTVTTYLVAWR